jgi:hypothetical protein
LQASLLTRKIAVRCALLSAVRELWGALPVVLVAAGAAGAETVLLTGDLGYEAQVVRQLDAGSEVDAQLALFRVANSGIRQPSDAVSCDSGNLPVNRYPLQIRESPGVTLHGGLFAGEVPLMSDWQSTYCNSAAAALRSSPGAKMEYLRMRRVWDAVRMSEDSDGFVLRESWISEVRDDCIENDHLNSGVIEDMLLDGCFSGLSMRPPKGEDRSPTGGAVVLNGVLARMESYIYKGQLRHGPPFKVDEVGPLIEIHNSVIAMDDPHMVAKLRLSIGWTRIGSCSGNLLLWTADTPWPDNFAKPPACFRLVEGAEARALWHEARRNWIDCHPKISRFADDQSSTLKACDVSAYGGHFARIR